MWIFDGVEESVFMVMIMSVDRSDSSGASRDVYPRCVVDCRDFQLPAHPESLAMEACHDMGRVDAPYAVSPWRHAAIVFPQVFHRVEYQAAAIPRMIGSVEVDYATWMSDSCRSDCILLFGCQFRLIAFDQSPWHEVPLTRQTFPLTMED